MKPLNSILIFFIALIFTNSKANTQEENPEYPKLPVQIVVEDNLRETASAFTSRFESDLETRKIEFWERDHDIYVLVRVWRLNTGETAIDISNWNLFLLTNVSPILSAQSPSISRVIIDSDEFEQRIDLAVNIATAVSLYTLGRCEDFNNLLLRLSPLPNDDYQIYTMNSMLFLQGNCAILQNDLEKAKDFFRDNLNLYTDSEPRISVTTNLAWVYVATHEQGKAEEIMNDLLTKHEFLKLGGGLSTYIDILIAHAELFSLISDFNVAIRDMNEAIELRSNLPFLYVKRGQIYLAQYEWDKALADFNTALDLDSDYAPAYFHRGVLYYSILQTGLTTRDDALADFQRYLELAPQGEFATEAAEYVENIQRELEALNG